MWKHLKEGRSRDGLNSKLPRMRYYKVVVLIACHGFLDFIAFAVYCVATLTPDISPVQKLFLQNFSSTVAAYHVGCYPLVYCGVRDLKFKDQIKVRSIASSKRNLKSQDALIPISPISMYRLDGRSTVGMMFASPANSLRSIPHEHAIISSEKRVAMSVEAFDDPISEIT